ncbi:ABC transporter ATP-binding protein [Alcaligenes endophyticus]|uniref:ABC transporter ATP-binding protein n=1 Tax=Alcaligenes endophyticus TaxID=1929088 RepID=A0ABT8EHI0_9BURK|nr:ABC transporter ATP-binding protein [Alcaligenes endophyticus]MCX5592089.1 ABC transporter ATP-binding protein [Alcaligenes endophyticus]MDN4120736.1 ABC transporter ATP-binding protein [Alcaligenes endophyticus]
MKAQATLLEVRDLRTEFRFARTQWFPVVNNVSLEVAAGETLAVVGESGCGKSMLAYSIMRLLPDRIARPAGGQILLLGRDLASLREDEMRKVRGKDVSMIFQEPMTSLNPLMTVGRQVAESVIEHTACSFEAAHKRTLELFDLVGIPEPGKRFDQYPHHLSGGMRQRIVIAIALACNPKVLIADEPTTALDVTIQAQVLELIDRLKSEMGMGVILITHDLGVVAEWAQRVMVMYAGRKVEESDSESFFQAPSHPYSQALLASVPRPDIEDMADVHELAEIPGAVPPLNRLGAGCTFAPRCLNSMGRCRQDVPMLTEQSDGRQVACFNRKAGTLL